MQERSDLGTGESAPSAAAPQELAAMAPAFTDPTVQELQATFCNPAVAWLDRVKAMEDWMGARGVPLTAGQPLARDEFVAQAKALGIAVEFITTPISRFGNRPPELIAREGFQPNPYEKPGALLAHLERRSCNFVSCTEVGTEHVAEALAMARGSVKRVEPDLIGAAQAFAAEWKDRYLAARDVATKTDLTSGPEAVAKFFEAMGVLEAFKAAHRDALGVGQLQPFQQTFALFEYKVVGAEGVRPTAIAGFPYPHQREITVREVAPGQVVAYREVRVTMPWMLLGDFSITTSHGPSNSYATQLVGGSTVTFGAWREMPKSS
ncbi:MAG: hypothetical protein K1X79_00375 [Oligoflexia bacterium]|nr:hypothetical protein [Oligoflexia bacterium]